MALDPHLCDPIQPDSASITDPTKLRVVVVTSKSAADRTKLCHEPVRVDGEIKPRCDRADNYRVVDARVYPSREPCPMECWPNGVPPATSPPNP